MLIEHNQEMSELLNKMQDLYEGIESVYGEYFQRNKSKFNYILDKKHQQLFIDCGFRRIFGIDIIFVKNFPDDIIVCLTKKSSE